MGIGWLLEKLFHMGTLEDINVLRKYYGDERIKKEVVKIRWLGKYELSYISGIFDIPKEDFLTYQLIYPECKKSKKSKK